MTHFLLQLLAVAGARREILVPGAIRPMECTRQIGKGETHVKLNASTLACAAGLLLALVSAAPSVAQPAVDVTFAVDMSEIPHPDGAFITGSFTGPEGSWRILPMAVEGESVYSFRIALPPGEQGAYYFLRGDDWGLREAVPQPCAHVYGTDRRYVVAQSNVAFAYHYGSCEGLSPQVVSDASPTAPVPGPAETDIIEEITVTGNRRLFRDALEAKQASEHVVEALSLEDIDALPNVTIAEALVRLPGVNGTRDRGNQSQATIRGLGPRMVLGTVNGREVASAEPSRNIRWEQYPSELISEVQVYKTQSADLVAGGIAGTVNLDTVSPLAYSGPRYTLRGVRAYYEGGEEIPDYSPWGDRLSASLVQPVGDNVGVALGVTSQTQKNAFPSYQAWGFNTPGSWQPGLPLRGGDLDGLGRAGFVPWGIQLEVGRMHTERVGLLGALQFQPSDSIDIKYDALYAEFDMKIDQDQTWYQGIGNLNNLQAGQYSEVAVENRFALAATALGDETDCVHHPDPYRRQCIDIRHVLAQYNQRNAILAQGIHFDLSGESMQVELDVAYSQAERDNYWHGLYFDDRNATFNYDLRDRPSVGVPTHSPSARPEAASLVAVDCRFDFCGTENDHENQGSELVDETWSYALDFSRIIDGAALSSFDIGFRYAGRTKEVFWEQFKMPRGGPNTASPLPGGFKAYTLSAIETSPILTAFSFESAASAFGGIDYSLAAPDLERYWKVSETNSVGYIKANFEGTLWSSSYYIANVGVRTIKVATKSFNPEGAWVDNSYVETLPSATLNLFIDEERIMRLGIARAISRPPLDELRVGKLINAPAGRLEGNTGNPRLNPFISSQIDLSYEWYFAPESLLAGTLFYKQIEDYIGYTHFAVEEKDGRLIELFAPRNEQDGYLHGIEFTFQTPLTSFSPRVSQHFTAGIYTNYAYADSDIFELYPADNPYTIAGLAEHTATADLWLWWRNFDFRVGWKYHSDFTVGFGWDGSALSKLEAETSVSASVAYFFSDNVTVRFQGYNLTDEPARTTRNNSEHDLRRFDVYGRAFFLDVTWKM